MIYSMYYSNIDRRMITAQHRVFNAMGWDLRQEESDLPHGRWMDTVLERCGGPVLICDIDAIPLSPEAVERALMQAAGGALYGVTGYASHLPNDALYAHPSWMALSAEMWRKIGRPTCASLENHDVGQYLSEFWQASRLPMALIPVTSCLEPRWPVPGSLALGIGTTFGNQEVYHQFEARTGKHVDQFVAKCDEVIANLQDL